MVLVQLQSIVHQWDGFVRELKLKSYLSAMNLVLTLLYFSSSAYIWWAVGTSLTASLYRHDSANTGTSKRHNIMCVNVITSITYE